jgi:hypothetical protein
MPKATGTETSPEAVIFRNMSDLQSFNVILG